MEQQTEKSKKPQCGMPYDEGVTENGRCALCGGEIEQVFDENLAKHYGVYHSVCRGQYGEEIFSFDYKCKTCGNETFILE